MPKVLVQSHRGAGVLAPENTREAFELGWALGAVPEADVRTTSDGVIVALHDRDFSRVVNHLSPEKRALGVENVSFEELSKMDVAAEHEYLAPHRVVALDEVFVLLAKRPGRGLYLDIKNVVLENLANLVLRRKVDSQIIFASTEYSAHLTWKQLLPDSQTLLWMGGSEKNLAERLAELRKSNFYAVTQLQIHVNYELQAHGYAFDPSDGFLSQLGKELREMEILFQVLPWGASDPEVYRQLLGLGVQSFATDYPDIVLDLVKDFSI